MSSSSAWVEQQQRYRHSGDGASGSTRMHQRGWEGELVLSEHVGTRATMTRAWMRASAGWHSKETTSETLKGCLCIEPVGKQRSQASKRGLCKMGRFWYLFDWLACGLSVLCLFDLLAFILGRIVAALSNAWRPCLHSPALYQWQYGSPIQIQRSRSKSRALCIRGGSCSHAAQDLLAQTESSSFAAIVVGLVAGPLVPPASGCCQQATNSQRCYYGLGRVRVLAHSPCLGNTCSELGH